MKAFFWRALACGAGIAMLAAPPAMADAPAPPMALPGDAVAASAPAASGTWIVGARPGARTRAVARRFGAEHVGPAGTGGYAVAHSRARAFARALGSRLTYAQPDTLAQPLQRAVAQDPLAVAPNDWRDWIVNPALTPPVVDANSPLIAVVDAQLDRSHPEWQGGNTDTIDQFAVTNAHGTATTSVAAAPVNGLGIVGVWPGARALNLPLSEQLTCRERADQIGVAIERKAAVINMSYGANSVCFPEYLALQVAVASGIVPVAAAGNEFTEGNPAEFPASLPHVVTVAAVGPPPELPELVLLERQRRDRPLGAGREHHDRRPDRPRFRRRRLRAAERHELRRSDGGRRDRLGARRAPGPDARPGGPGRAALRRRPRRPGLGP